MPISGDDRQISLEEVVSAAVTHELSILVERLARERAWGSLLVTFGYAAGARAAAALEEVRAAAETLRAVLRTIPVPKRPGAALADQLRAARIAAGEALLARLSHPPLGDGERRALTTAAEILSEGGDYRRAATAYEELGDDARAADAYGAMGDLEQMETALAREDARLRARREALDDIRTFETLMAAGERRAALLAAARIPGGAPTAAAIRQRASEVESNLVREHALSLRTTARVAGGTAGAASVIRYAAIPAVLGRDLNAEVPVRDPGVSRRHAVIVSRGGELVIEDAGSRTGVRIAGAALDAALPLRGDGELGLGRDCRIQFQTPAPGRVILRGASGLDRQLIAVVGIDPFPLDELIPGAAGVWLELGAGMPRLARALGTSVRVGGHLVGPACDLMHGDMIEIAPASNGAGPPATLRLEVE